MPIWDEDRPLRPPQEDPEPEPEPDPPSDSPGWIDPGLQPGDPVLPQPEPEPEPEPAPEPEYDPVGFILGGEDTLNTKHQTYGGAGANCRSRSTNWGDMASMPYWLEGAVNAGMSGSTVTLQSHLDSWRGDDSVFGVIAADSYIELSVTYSAKGATGYQGMQDSSFSFSVCLEGGDSFSASVGSGVNDFSIVKNGTERLNYSEFAAANAVWTEFTIRLTIDKAVHCSGSVEQTPDQWDIPPAQDTPIEDDEGSDGGEGAEGGFEWSQSDSWVLLGVLVLILLGYYVRNTTRGGDCAE